MDLFCNLIGHTFYFKSDLFISGAANKYFVFAELLQVMPLIMEKYKLFHVTKFLLVFPTFWLIQQLLSGIMTDGNDCW